MARGVSVLLVALLISAAIAHSQAPAAQAPASATPAQPAAWEPPIVPVYHEPHHRQVFQKGPVRILDLQIPPGDMSWFHSHESPVLYVTLGTSATRTQNLGGEWGGGGGRGGAARAGQPGAAGRGAPATGAPAAGAPAAGVPAAGTVPAGATPAGASPAGTPPTGRAAGAGRGGGTQSPRATSTTSYAQQPVTHRLENIGTGLFRAMVVINETPGDETTTEQEAGFEGKPELTNRWFRAYRVTLAPGQKTPAHRHRAPVAIIQATAGKGLGAGPMTFEFNEPGQWAFFDADASHEVSNRGDAPLELIEVEVRSK